MGRDVLAHAWPLTKQGVCHISEEPTIEGSRHQQDQRALPKHTVNQLETILKAARNAPGLVGC
jgi:hypothetical protein